MRRRDAMCDGCPFNADRVGPPIDADTRRAVAQRIRGGEAWVCHQTCEGARVVETSELCAGAPADRQITNNLIATRQIEPPYDWEGWSETLDDIDSMEAISS